MENVQILIGIGLGVQVFSSSLFPGLPHEAAWLFPCFPAEYSTRGDSAAHRQLGGAVPENKAKFQSQGRGRAGSKVLFGSRPPCRGLSTWSRVLGRSWRPQGEGRRPWLHLPELILYIN